MSDSHIGSPLYLNRELSWLAFDARVLHEALDPRVPLLERAKFLGIFSANLDEFYMVRIAGLRRQVAAGVVQTPTSEHVICRSRVGVAPGAASHSMRAGVGAGRP